MRILSRVLADVDPLPDRDVRRMAWSSTLARLRANCLDTEILVRDADAEVAGAMARLAEACRLHQSARRVYTDLLAGFRWSQTARG